jgi:hypothetical protein
VEESVRQCLERGATINVEYRIQRTPGETRWLVSRGRSYPAAPELPARLMGVSLDITARKEMEVRLREQLEEIKRLKSQLEQENLYLRSEIVLQHGHEGIVGRSPALKRVLAQVEQVAGTDATVLLAGGNRHRQGASGPHHSQPEPPQGPPAVDPQLRGPAPHPDRKRALRPGEGRLHRGPDPHGRPLRGGPPIDALSGRNRRAAPGPAGQAAAGSGGWAVRTPGLHQVPSGGRPDHRGHQPGPGPGGRRRKVSQRSLLPAERVPDCGSAAARTPRGHPPAGLGLRQAEREKIEQTGRAHRPPQHGSPQRAALGRATPGSCATSSSTP